MPLSAFEVLDRVYGVQTRSETGIFTVGSATAAGWYKFLNRDSSRVGLTAAVTSGNETVYLAPGPLSTSQALQGFPIGVGGSLRAALWEDFGLPTNEWWLYHDPAITTPVDTVVSYVYTEIIPV